MRAHESYKGRERKIKPLIRDMVKSRNGKKFRSDKTLIDIFLKKVLKISTPQTFRPESLQKWGAYFR
jgi:hypothetical protein